jgi:hypothetical protein
MKRSWLGKLSLTAITLAVLAIGSVRAEEVGQVVVIREAGKPDHRCLIERSTLQTNGTKIYDVRDLDTGERLRVLDKRTAKPTPSAVTQAAAKQTVPSDAGMTAALAGSPFAPRADDKHVPTLAEQALVTGKTGVVRAGLFRFFDK